MFVELATAIENAGGSISAPERFNEIQDVRELLTCRQPSARRCQRNRRRGVDDRKKDDEIHIPSFVQNGGNKAGDFLQRFLYDQFLRTHYEGRSNIPPHTNFIVAANHCSHLDMGLTKMALGESGKDMVALAAADYFFDTKYKRAVMENFTNLVPMERTGSLRQSLRHANSFLDRGYNALIFPEGTRSMTGIMADFKPVVGYLALHARVGILPMYLDGTYEAMPKGTTIIKSRDVGARIGRFSRYRRTRRDDEGHAARGGLPADRGAREARSRESARPHAHAVRRESAAEALEERAQDKLIEEPEESCGLAVELRSRGATLPKSLSQLHSAKTAFA